jgi:hypothetical protein
LWGQQTMHPQPGAGVRRPGRIFGMPPRSPPHRLVHERTVSPLRFMPAVYQQSSGEVGRPGSLLGCIRYTVSRRLPACQARQSWPPPGPRSPGSSLVADDSITLATARAAFPRVVPGGRRQHHPRHRPSRNRPSWRMTCPRIRRGSRPPPRSRCLWNRTVAPLTSLVYVLEGRPVVLERRDEVRTWRVCGVNS